MKSMPFAMAAAAVVALAFASGCGTDVRAHGSAPDPTVVAITLAPAPAANPDPLRVSPGDRFVFDSDVEFAIAFVRESPDKDDPKLKWKASREQDGRFRTKVLKAKGKKGTYEYNIQAGGMSGDPAIIIQ